MKKKIMVIDDEKDFLAITKLNLESTGKYEVLCLSNAEDILLKLRTFNPDVIMLDMRMPILKGKDACEVLSSDSIGKNVPVIVVSSWSDDRNMLEPYKQVVAHFTKPVAIESLIAKIDEIRPS
jgi:two-component system alkaline phosphatase synthesis response regulator PhoP